MYVNSNTVPYVTAPPLAVIATIPPATAPSIYFAGTPASLVTINSYTQSGYCNVLAPNGFTANMGPIQSVPVSSLGLTLPFSVK
jgi:hypothetical protein